MSVIPCNRYPFSRKRRQRHAEDRQRRRDRKWAKNNCYVEVWPGKFVSEYALAVKPEFGGYPP